MMPVTHKELMPGVRLTAVHTDKFKSSYLSVSLLVPMDAETASANALVPYVLCRGTRDKPHMEALSAALDELYGGSVEPMVRKKGETQCVGLAGSFLDDAYALAGETLLEPAAALLGDILLRPAQEDGKFRRDYVDSEKANLMDRMEAQINEKRSYSILRLTREMCAGEAYGVDRLGDKAHAAALTPDGVWEAYQKLLAEARVELYYCGSALPERVEKALLAALGDLPRGGARELPGCRVVDHAGEVRLAEERLDVTQGKLALGFRTGGACLGREDYPALLVFNALYGGTATSKLFLNVREKLSLCYFASSMLEKRKGVMLVSSGIEFQNYEKAKEEILAQLEAVKAGEFEEWELVGAIQAVISVLGATADSQGQLEDYWLTQAAAGEAQGPEALAEQVSGVSREAVMAVARGMELDTIYFLKGLEG